jgi:HSP20 family protein
MTLTRWNPTRELWGIAEDMNRLVSNIFGDFNRDTAFFQGAWTPTVDIGEDKDNFYLRIDLPGMTKDDVRVNYEDGILTIKGERKDEWQDNKDLSVHRTERFYGKFERSFTVPRRILDNKIVANFKNGVLLVTLPKVEEVKPKEIEVKIS